jgi:hypothetical protein
MSSHGCRLLARKPEPGWKQLGLAAVLPPLTLARAIVEPHGAALDVMEDTNCR